MNKLFDYFLRENSDSKIKFKYYGLVSAKIKISVEGKFSTSVQLGNSLLIDTVSDWLVVFEFNFGFVFFG